MFRRSGLSSQAPALPTATPNSLFRPSTTPPVQQTGFSRAFRPGHLTLGLGYPIEAIRPDRPHTEKPTVDLGEHVRLTRLAEEGGFAAVWARDIPLHDADYGDVGQVHDPWTFLSYIAAHTSRIALGTAGVVLPLHPPVDVAKQAASLDQISSGRFLLGVVTGDRPVEYQAFGKNPDDRAGDFREAVGFIRKAQSVSFRPVVSPLGQLRGADLIPKPTTASVPILPTGSCQQSMEWLAEHGDGWVTYPRGPQQQKKLVAQWHDTVAQVAGKDSFKPFVQFLSLDLHPDPDAELHSLHMGYRVGRNTLLEFLRVHQDMGVNHISFGLRASERPLDEVIEELNEYVLPRFPALNTEAE